MRQLRGTSCFLVLQATAELMCCLQVVDQAGEEHEVLLRHWTSSTGLRMYMLERARPLLEAGSAREGFKLQLQHEEGQPMVSTGRGLVKNRAMLLRGSCGCDTCRTVPAVPWQTSCVPCCVAAWPDCSTRRSTLHEHFKRLPQRKAVLLRASAAAIHTLHPCGHTA